MMLDGLFRFCGTIGFHTKMRRLVPAVLFATGLLAGEQRAAEAAEPVDFNPAEPAIVHADIVALDQTIVYNRFGSFDPYGMIFALERDVSAMAGGLGDQVTAANCANRTGAESGEGVLIAGQVRLKDCKRPRPLVLRARVGDILRVRVTNLLKDYQPGVSETFCHETAKDSGLPNINTLRANVSEDGDRTIAKAMCGRKTADGKVHGVKEPGDSSDWPRTRGLSFIIPGVEPIPAPGTQHIEPACIGTGTMAPGESRTCHFRLEREGTHLFQSLGATAGGEGDGGSLTHGLFGSLIVEPKGSLFYRSQVPMKAFDEVWARDESKGVVHARLATPVYARLLPEPGDARPERAGNPCTDQSEMPLAAMLRDCGKAATFKLPNETVERSYQSVEIVHSDINAIIVPREVPASSASAYDRPKAEPFREFVVIFHDELKTYYTKNFESLAAYDQFSGIRDGFAINYGASGAGSLVLANRQKIGPAANCPECMYEEFFLESWASGDPALLENFVDDPSNVHHSYLNDRVVFRNFHAGPKETHIFHLHSHQWFAGNDKNRGAYLDSQTIGPQQGMSYDIYGGGTELYRFDKVGKKGWYETLGSGNRNRTPGDAIFHCHLYPHFAQGMWELWRVHDVLEDGTRTLPDGQKVPGLSIAANAYPGQTRSGTTGNGPWLWNASLPAKSFASQMDEGTPIPGLLPIPRQAAPLLPTYDKDRGFPGYPFYVAGEIGHRTPQAPMDVARDTDGRLLDGGLGRHVITAGRRLSDIARSGTDAEKQDFRIKVEDGVPKNKKGEIIPLSVAQALSIGDLTEEYANLAIKLLPQDGTDLERRAMAFHHQGLIEGKVATPLDLKTVNGDALAYVPGNAPADKDKAAYASVEIPEVPATPVLAHFAVNGAAPRPGAPFADPCGAPDGLRDSAIADPFGTSKGSRPKGISAHLIGGDDPTYPAGMTSSYPPKDMTYDPGLAGFRRFEASVVQFDMAVNKAGWHDPQTRINVLTSKSGDYKDKTRRGNEEPFYFRAFSGECIEFRHTNEAPHKLALDDFQTKVPTDTIGQHIHLVKFDVTSSDGSGNGFNYEDGTFAPDELAERIHASTHGLTPAEIKTGVIAKDGHQTGIDTTLLTKVERDAFWENHAEWATACEPSAGKIWELKRGDNNHKRCFQTTVQRWFADPILSPTGETDPARQVTADRTLRTVFTHDHFGPSNIQQHGFYSALLIEPTHMIAKVYGSSRTSEAVPKKASLEPWGVKPRNSPTTPEICKGLLNSAALATPGGVTEFLASCIATAGYAGPDKSGEGVGARATLHSVNPANNTVMSDPLHPNYREFALAIADFALLYDGKPVDNPVPPGAGAALSDADGYNGLDRLVAEARIDFSKVVSKAGKPICTLNRGGAHDEGEGVLAPAFAVACEIEEPALAPHTQPAWLDAAGGQVAAVFSEARKQHGKPVNPPKRPEAISQKHHDPYLVNYQTEPMPLRVGETVSGKSLNGDDRKCFDATHANDHADSVYRQRTDDKGDMSRVFRTLEHGDPCTPILEAYSGERVMLRVIQGAQEVQHVVTVEGRGFRRNVDQKFAYGARLGPFDENRKRLRWQACMDAAMPGRALQHSAWFNSDGLGGSPSWLARYRQLAASCDNVDGFTTAQEIGISEHFEIAATFSSDAGLASERAFVGGQREPLSALPMRDSLFHFGSVDALWNGAWGLLRIYANTESSDTTSCLATAAEQAGRLECLDPAKHRGMVGDRLKRVPVGGAIAESALNGADLNRVARLAPAGVMKTMTPPGLDQPNLACPFVSATDDAGKGLSGADNETRHVFQALIAVSGRDLGLDRGLTGVAYDAARGIYDPDALLLVPVDPFTAGSSSVPLLTRVAVFDAERLGALGADGRSGVIDRSAAIAAAKAVVKERGRVPGLVRINAGDCLHLVVVNTLAEASSIEPGSHRKGLKDVPGDATMPKITRLNTDQYFIKDKGREVFDGTTGELAPSASLALSIPLSLVSNVNDVPDPVGANPRRALDPAKGNAAPYAVMTYFGGTIAYDAAMLDRKLRTAEVSATNLVQDAAGPVVGHCIYGAGNASYRYRIWPASDAACEIAGPLNETVIGVNVLGKRYCATAHSDVSPANPLTPRHDEVEACMRHHVTYAVARDNNSIKLRVVARAFGALPVKSLGDVISHGVHGLAATLLVEPVNATYRSAAGIAADLPPMTHEVARPPQLLSVDSPTSVPDVSEVAQSWTWTEAPRTSVASDPMVMLDLEAFTLHPVCDNTGHAACVPGSGTMADYPELQIAEAEVREHSLLWQDGLNLWDSKRSHSFYALPPPLPGGPIPDCTICDDSYDLGEKGVSYGNAALFARVRGLAGGSNIPKTIGPDEHCSQSNRPIYHGGPKSGGLPAQCDGAGLRSGDLNAWTLPEDVLSLTSAAGGIATPVMVVRPEEEIAIRIVEPQGRARQRSFVPLGAGYHDMFPGFGSGHSILLAPGKAVTATLRAPATVGDYLWFDGPRQLFDGGAWGVMRVQPE